MNTLFLFLFFFLRCPLRPEARLKELRSEPAACVVSVPFIDSLVGVSSFPLSLSLSLSFSLSLVFPALLHTFFFSLPSI